MNFLNRPLRLSFTVSNWYWFVADDTTQVYSSAKQAFVPANDAELAAWIESGGRVTRIANVDELNEVLTARGQSAVPTE